MLKKHLTKIITSIVLIAIIIFSVMWVMMQGPARDKLQFKGNYQSYEIVSGTIATTDKMTVLFFYATRCPTCRSAHQKFLANADNIPLHLQVVNIDYDTNMQLRKKYNVVKQHTFVLIDHDGNEIAKQVGGDTVEDVVQFVQPFYEEMTQKKGSNNLLEELLQEQAIQEKSVDQTAKEGSDQSVTKAVLTESKIESEVKEEMSSESKSKGIYQSYEAGRDSIATTNKMTILFFDAKRCPTCRSANNELTNHVDNIPADLQILNVDYDTNMDLRKQYNIAQQHTFVLIDHDGNEVAKQVGGNSVEEIVAFTKPFREKMNKTNNK